MRVDIDLPVDVLAWAAYRATELGISRRQYLTRLVIRHKEKHYKQEIPSYIITPLTPEECFKKE